MTCIALNDFTASYELVKAVNWQTLAIIAVIAYFIGNVQTALFISRRKFRDDVRRYGSGNSGAANMFRVYGRDAGITTFLGDAVKCVAGMLIGRGLGAWLGVFPGQDAVLGSYCAGIFVVIGHCYPVLLRFKGGKGAASSFAFMWFVFPLGALITTVLAVFILIIGRRMSVVSMLSAVLFLVSVIVFNSGNTAMIITVALDVFFVLLRHKDNIIRLIRGEEKPIKERSV